MCSRAVWHKQCGVDQLRLNVCDAPQAGFFKGWMIPAHRPCAPPLRTPALLQADSRDAVGWLEGQGIDLSGLVQLGGHSKKRTHTSSRGPVGFSIMKALLDRQAANERIQVISSANVRVWGRVWAGGRGGGKLTSAGGHEHVHGGSLPQRLAAAIVLACPCPTRPSTPPSASPSLPSAPPRSPPCCTRAAGWRAWSTATSTARGSAWRPRQSSWPPAALGPRRTCCASTRRT